MAYLLSNVRGAGKLSNGMLFVVDGGSRQVRFYDESGTYVFHVGREGSGPGEFGAAPILVPESHYDSVTVLDNRLQRFSTFSSEGEFTRSGSSSAPAPLGAGTIVTTVPVGLASEGAVIRRASTGIGAMSEGVQPPGRVQFRVVRADAEAANVVIDVEDVQYFITPPNAAGEMGRFRLPFSIAPLAAVADNRLYLNPGRGSEILELGLSGELLRITRLREPDRTASEDDRMSFAEAELAWMREGEGKTAALSMYSEMPLPDRMPVYQSLVVDDQGWVWAELYRTGLSELSEWLVFDSEGRGRGKIQIPNDIQVLQVGGDFILGLWQDDFQVQYVQLFELMRN
jgi:hypothetical protein